ncbi:MAG: AraC family transcriptional regulator [Verrucomicrobiota bacterium]|nr:AraC family transcriptional regulator [Verrucomicrobiota bacterium]
MLLKNKKQGLQRILFPKKGFSLRAMITNCGFENITTEDYSWDGMQRGNAEFTVWQYTLEGSGMLDYDGKTYSVCSGEAMLLHIPHEHRYYYKNSSENWKFLYISLTGREIMRIWRKIEKKTGPIATFSKNSKLVDFVWEIYNLSINGKIQSSYKASYLAYKMIMLLAEELPVSHHADNRQEPPFIADVTDFCIKNLHKPIGVEQMAEASGYSRYHFSREFKLWQGETPLTFLTGLRMQKAVMLLQTEQLNIKQIAYACGFTDSSYFCKVFKKKYGTSPDLFRHAKEKKSYS